MPNKEKAKNGNRNAHDIACTEEITTEIIRLIDKYSGGRTPPLFSEQDEQQGLVSTELLQIYQKGFTGRHLIPLGILIPKNDCKGRAKWDRANTEYHPNLWSKNSWTKVCSTIRSQKEGERMCDNCDRIHAKLAGRTRDVIAYMGIDGMIDFTMPVFVDDKLIATVFTGQKVPKKGCFWNKEFVEEDGVFSIDRSIKSGVNARKVTIRRLRDAEEKYNLEPGILIRKLGEDLEESKNIEVAPRDVEDIRNMLRVAGQHLSDLAQKTYRLEKSKAVAAIRSAIAKSLGHEEVDIEHDTLLSLVERLSYVAELICKYFALDYMLIINVKKDMPSFRLLLEHTSHKTPWKKGIWTSEIREESFEHLLETLSRCQKIVDANLWSLRKAAFFDWMASWLKETNACRCIMARLDRPGLSPCVLFAGKAVGLQLSDFNRQDRDDFCRIVEDIGNMVNTALFIDELRATAESQRLFMEDVAHDIRNPIQNILIKAENLKSGLIKSNELPDQLRKLESQVRRLDILSQRVWFTEKIRQNPLEVYKTSHVHTHQIIYEAIEMIKDAAKANGISLCIGKDIHKWPAINIDRELFFLAILNLIDNAVKYSHKNTEIRIDGNISNHQCEILVVNKGVGIKTRYRDKIFTRSFRTPEAMMYVRQGLGNGLSFVKAFADIYGSVDYKSTPVYGTDYYVTEFRLNMKGVV